MILVVAENALADKNFTEFPCPKHKNNTSTFGLTVSVNFISKSPIKSWWMLLMLFPALEVLYTKSSSAFG